MRAAIMQPTYLPYIGYFHLMRRVDVFVFLDDVQLERRSWQTRNRICAAGEEQMLSVSLKKHNQTDRLDEVFLNDEGDWRRKHLDAMDNAYRKRPGFAEGIDFIRPHLTPQPDQKLSDFNIAIIEDAARRLGITTLVRRASALGCGGKRSEHLLAICRAVGATAYVSPTGSREYMEEEGVFRDAGFPVAYFSHAPKVYPQGFEPFVPYMAFIDAVMNIGFAGLTELLADA
ncbi:wbqC-like family protein [Asticcacaulis biprosthecium C19]|uniref:WbqC-like family protein n=2 Tax=Asticcacaulis biprosthecium TaxID=76891 RepID=F4QLR6_9CAUL|nr:wbqC-like family protein [Asticcacaulis biprosthecium C19]